MTTVAVSEMALMGHGSLFRTKKNCFNQNFLVKTKIKIIIHEKLKLKQLI